MSTLKNLHKFIFCNFLKLTLKYKNKIIKSQEILKKNFKKNYIRCSFLSGLHINAFAASYGLFPIKRTW